jgi:hypothetical protein
MVCYHTQIQGPVYGATTHENSTTMRAYMGMAWHSIWWMLVWHTNQLDEEAAMANR